MLVNLFQKLKTTPTVLIRRVLLTWIRNRDLHLEKNQRSWKEAKKIMKNRKDCVCKRLNPKTCRTQILLLF